MTHEEWRQQDSLYTAVARCCDRLQTELGAAVVFFASDCRPGPAYDPAAMAEAGRLYAGRADLHLAKTPEEALQGADALVVVTEWKQFRSPDFSRLKGVLKDAVIFDGRNLYEPAEVEQAGIAYYGIGRGRSIHAE